MVFITKIFQDFVFIRKYDVKQEIIKRPLDMLLYYICLLFLLSLNSSKLLQGITCRIEKENSWLLPTKNVYSRFKSWIFKKTSWKVDEQIVNSNDF